MFEMTWACGLVLVLLFPQFPSIREIDFSGTTDIDVENELLPRAPGKQCGEEDAVNLQNLDLSMIPTHVIRSDKIRHVDLSFNKISDIPNSFFLDVPNIECLNLTANAYPAKDVFHDSSSYSLKTLVLDRISSNGYDNYDRCTMTGHFPNLETLHLSDIERCSIDASIEAKLPGLATLYLMGYGSSLGSRLWRLPTTLRHLHLEGTRFNEFPLNAVSNLQSLYLDRYNYNNDFHIPSEIVNLEVVSCRNCSLRTTEIETFFDSPRNALRALDLSQNSLYYLPDNMFQYTSNLESLLLSNNMFSIMPDVQVLSRLRGLVLNHNRINEVAERKSDSLKILCLRGNGISHINATTFQGYPVLEILDLSENKLASLPIGWAHSLEHLLTLNLKSNSFARFSDTSLTTANSDLRHLFMTVYQIERFDEQDFKLLPDNCTIHFAVRNLSIIGTRWWKELSRMWGEKTVQASLAGLTALGRVGVKFLRNTTLLLQMATDRRWELLAVLLLTLQPAMGDPEKPSFIDWDHSTPGKFRHPSSTPPTVIKTPKPYTWTNTPKPEICSADVVLRLSRVGIRVVGDNVVNSWLVRELHLDDNEITEVSSGAFNKTPNLDTLNLSLNNIRTDRLLYFGEHKRLSRLIVDDNKYQDPENSELKTFLNSLPNLWELSLRRSFIAVFSVSLTEFAPNLGRLSLSGNKIESSDFLKDVPKTLKYLDLSENEISEIRFSLAISLLELTVAGNRIKELCSESCEESSLSLRKLGSLRKLNASRNAIVTVQADAFQWLTDLTVLDLSRNKISKLPETLWGWWSQQIKELYLAKNNLTSVPKLCELRNLQRLDLSGNSIFSLTDEDICGTLTQLQSLFLNDNLIFEVDGAAFRKFIKLRMLDLSGNLLTTVPSYLINSTSLQQLFIRRSQINTLQNLAKEWSNLRELHLQDNPLLSIHTKWIDWRILPYLQIMLKDQPVEGKADQYCEKENTTQQPDSSW
ncbi:uncharacterized protein LOC143210791 [Lasioglossum baleicum]|uniref:uncharacterized protein LOC143210791 n=1 Tax=Lasioglossum baleicum TaxID=434251 RepID=UPI003FCECB09